MKYLWLSLVIPLLAGLSVAACVSAIPAPAAGPVTATTVPEGAYPPPTFTAEMRAYPGPQPTATLPPLTATAAATSTSTPTPIPTIPVTLPEPGALHWEIVGQGAGTLRRLAGLTTAVLDADPSPDGRWWVVTLPDQTGAVGWYSTALYVLDGIDDGHWFAGRSDYGHFSQHTWLPDGRLLWTDEGHLFLAEGNGQNRRDLGAPEPVHEVWLGADGIALVSGETTLWRLSLTVGAWNEVGGLNVKGSPVSRSSANLTIAPDGTFAALIHTGDLWYVSVTAEEPAKWLATIEYFGREGRIHPLYPLADSPFWLIGEVVAGYGRSAGVLVDSRNGTLVPAEELLPHIDADSSSISFPIGLQAMHPLAGGGSMRLRLSPDGRWVVRPLSTDDSTFGFPSALYIAPSSDLAAGRIFSDVAIMGWQSEPAAVFFMDRSSDPAVLVRVPLLGGEPIPLLDRPASLSDIAVSATSDTIFIAELEAMRYRLHTVTLDGTPLKTVDLPTTYDTPRTAFRSQRPTVRILRPATSARTLLVLRNAEGETLWLWDTTPATGIRVADITLAGPQAGWAAVNRWQKISIRTTYARLYSQYNPGSGHSLIHTTGLFDIDVVAEDDVWVVGFGGHWEAPWRCTIMIGTGNPFRCHPTFRSGLLTP
ncbi:MAG: hypothetical protein ACE5LU_13265 [Anaerolineae bacterium]